MTESRPNRSELLEWINVVSFAVDDVKLFLDTHPCNEDANTGAGLTSHGHGRKEDADICGIMKSDCSTL